MAKSTAPILLTGGASFANTYLTTGQVNLRPLLGAGIAALALAGIEQVPGMAPVAAGVAWVAFVTLMLTRASGKPSPIETIGKVTGL